MVLVDEALEEKVCEMKGQITQCCEIGNYWKGKEIIVKINLLHSSQKSPPRAELSAS